MKPVNIWPSTTARRWSGWPIWLNDAASIERRSLAVLSGRRCMSDRTITHDATDWIRTLEELKSTGSRPAVETSRSDIGIGAAVELEHSPNPDLASRIEQALRATGYPPLRNLHVLAVEGIAILRGAVPSYYMKQIALAAVSVVPGVRRS